MVDAMLEGCNVDEVLAAVKRLHNGKSPGPDGIRPEMLKCCPTIAAQALHKLFINVWKTGRVPAEWREGIIVAIYKGKGNRSDCGNYRQSRFSQSLEKYFSAFYCGAWSHIS